MTLSLAYLLCGQEYYCLLSVRPRGNVFDGAEDLCCKFEWDKEVFQARDFSLRAKAEWRGTVPFWPILCVRPARAMNGWDGRDWAAANFNIQVQGHPFYTLQTITYKPHVETQPIFVFHGSLFNWGIGLVDGMLQDVELRLAFVSYIYMHIALVSPNFRSRNNWSMQDV